MRSERQMMELILKTAQEDERIRAVMMNGSRTNPKAPKDPFQDYDILYLVTDLAPFRSDPSWIDRFGTILIFQKPDEPGYIPPEPSDSYAYLMQFDDGNRIDLTLLPVWAADKRCYEDQLARILLDKDGLLHPIPPASDRDYWVTRPDQTLFSGCCNEFWWVCCYAAKGLWRGEVLYAAEHLHTYIRPMLLQMLDWHVGIQTDFSVSTGKCHKYLPCFLSDGTAQRLYQTYSDVDQEHMWHALFIQTELFSEYAHKVANHFGFSYNETEEKNVIAHLRHVHGLARDAKEIY